ncbi:MAG: septal ring lytic transglycosylase RlpA family protein [Alcaligenaceae bacterium]|nr:septal ring lytic transglycosylase RlpA family protein [Alcaligenaceae bacterium]
MSRLRISPLLSLCILLAALAGCASHQTGGGYYKDDGPGSNIPADVQATPDAVPRVETHARANFRPYTVFGHRYVPIQENQPYRETGTASWYGRKFHGQSTANGETYDMYAMTAAHPTLPIPSYARVTRVSNGKSVIVRINDRGPFHSSRIIDLSYAAAAKLGLIGPGHGKVIVEAITNDDIRSSRRTQTRTASTKPATTPVQHVAAAPPPNTTTDTSSDTARQQAPPPTQNALLSPREQGVFLQFGAFASQHNAQSLVTRINQQSGGMSGSAKVQYSDSLYKVRIGPFPSRTAAVNAAWALQQSTGLGSSIAVD